MVLGIFPVSEGRLTNLITVGQGPVAFAICSGRSCLNIFLSSIIYVFLLPLFFFKFFFIIFFLIFFLFFYFYFNFFIF